MYRLTPGATSASAVFDFTSGGFAKWLVASGDSVWLDAQPRPVSETSTVWELRGPDAVPVWHEAASDIIATVNEWQTGPSGMVGSGADGLWTVVVSASAFRQQVIRMGRVPENSRSWRRWRRVISRCSVLPRSFSPGRQRRSTARCSFSTRLLRYQALRMRSADSVLFIGSPERILTRPAELPAGASAGVG